MAMRDLTDGVAVVGSGIAGLATAAALRTQHVPVEVIEAEASGPPRRPGRGLCLWSRSLSALEGFGLGDLSSRGARLDRVQVWSTRGRLLMDLSARYAPVGALAIRHDELVDALVGACLDVPCHTGQRLVGYAEDERGLLLSCCSGWTLRSRFGVGADGAGSMMRDLCLDDGAAVYSGDSVIEGISDRAPPLDAGALYLFWGPFAVRAGAMPVDGNGRWAWWIAEPGGSERALHPDPSELRGLLADLGSPLSELVAATPAAEITRTDVLARRHPGAPGRGLVALVGDAWHPLPLVEGMDVSLALEDAVDLAEVCATTTEAGARLAAYEKRRRARVEAVSTSVWLLRALAARSSYPAVWARDFATRHLPRRWLERHLGQLLTGAPDHPGGWQLTGAPLPAGR